MFAAHLHRCSWPLAGSAALVLFALIGCQSEPASPSPSAELTGRVVLTGSSTIAPLMADIASRFEQQHPQVRVEVQSGGTSRGLADVRRGIAQVGLVSRRLTADEARELEAFPIAQDGVAVIVHADNPVGEITDQALRAIYTGRITRWNELGGPDAAITVVNKAQGRSTLEIFAEYLNIEPAAMRASIVIGENQQGIQTVAGDPHAIGYVSIGTAQVERDAGRPIRLLAVGGVAATSDHVAAGRFPLVRPLNLVTQGPVGPEVRALLEYAQSTAVHDLVEAHAFVPLAD